MKLTLFLNHRCNLRCTYCYTGEKFDRRMDWDVARRAVDFGVANSTEGWLLLAFFGGEPMLELALMQRALEYAAEQCAARKLRLYTSVATNGTALDDRRLALLKRYKSHVQVSFDGVKAAHDATRPFMSGRSSFTHVQANLKRLVGAGLAPWVISVIDPSTVHALADSFDFLADQGAAYVNLSPNYLGAWDDDARGRFEGALGQLGDRYLARMRKGQQIRVDPLDGKLANRLSTTASAKALCKFGVGDLAVSPSGKLYPCERLINEDDDASVCVGDLERGLDVARRDAMLSQRIDDAQCTACPVKARCKRWCGCANYETTGDPSKVSPLVCWFERCFIAEADRLGNTLYEERNPVFLKRFYPASAQV